MFRHKYRFICCTILDKVLQFQVSSTSTEANATLARGSGIPKPVYERYPSKNICERNYSVTNDNFKSNIAHKILCHKHICRRERERFI